MINKEKKSNSDEESIGKQKYVNQLTPFNGHYITYKS